MRGPIAAALACAMMIASHASAAPFVAVDGSTRYMAMLDEGTIARSNGAVDAEALLVMAGGGARLARFHFECASRTWRPVSFRSVGADLTLSAPTSATDPAAAVQPGSLGASLLERACFGRLVNAGGGWSKPTLREALDAARAVLARANGQP